ncbi:MAG: hypothetical protein WC759_00210 [Candidatus Micrarchaeia archaeon]
MRFAALALLALAALFAAGCAAPAIPPTGTAADFNIVWSNWVPIAGIAVLISMCLVSIGYMLRSLLSNQQIMTWAKGEFLQVLASALIIGGLFWLVGTVTALSAQLAGYTGIDCANTDVEDTYAQQEIALAPCHINIAQQYLQIMYENVYHQNRQILRAATLLAVASNFNITLEMLVTPWLSVTLVPLAPLNMVYETLAMVFDMLMKIMLLLKFQIYFMSFTWRALFPMLLVGGVILRTFWFSRRLGGLLIAIAFGIYMAYPLSYALAYYVLGGTSSGTYVVNIDSSKLNDANFNLDTMDSDTIAQRINKLEGKNWIGDVLSVGGVGLGTLVGVGTLPVGAPGALAPGAPIIENWVAGENGIIESTAILLIYATFVPFLALMSTLSFIKALSPLLGGDVDIAGITHLI